MLYVVRHKFAIHQIVNYWFTNIFYCVCFVLRTPFSLTLQLVSSLLVPSIIWNAWMAGLRYEVMEKLQESLPFFIHWILILTTSYASDPPMSSIFHSEPDTFIYISILFFGNIGLIFSVVKVKRYLFVILLKMSLGPGQLDARNQLGLYACRKIRAACLLSRAAWGTGWSATIQSQESAL